MEIKKCRQKKEKHLELLWVAFGRPKGYLLFLVRSAVARHFQVFTATFRADAVARETSRSELNDLVRCRN